MNSPPAGTVRLREARRLGRGFLISLAIAAALSASCARKGASLSAGATSTVGSEPFDWSAPFMGQGVPLSDATSLNSNQVAFPLHIPNSLGPAKVFLPPNIDVAGKAVAVFFVFDDPSFRTVWVGESAPDIAHDAERLDTYKQIVGENGTPGRSVTAELVTIRRGTPALLGISDTGVTVQWVEGGTQFWVGSPNDTRDQILQVVENL